MVSRWVLGLVFVYAGSTKLMEPRVFATLIEAYGLVPDILLMPVAVLLPVIEVIAGLGILLDIKGSHVVILGLVGLFLLILGYGIWMGLDVDCGCFGPEDPEAKAFHGLRQAFARDLFMLTGIGFIIGWSRYRQVRFQSIGGYFNRLNLNRKRKEK